MKTTEKTRGVGRKNDTSSKVQGRTNDEDSHVCICEKKIERKGHHDVSGGGSLLNRFKRENRGIVDVRAIAINSVEKLWVCLFITKRR